MTYMRYPRASTYAVEAGYGLGQINPQPASCPYHPVGEARLIFQLATSAELATLRSRMCDDAGRLAVDQRDPDGLAFRVAGGDDCQVTSTCGRVLAAYFLELAERCRARAGLPALGANVAAYNDELARIEAAGGPPPPAGGGVQLPGLEVTVTNYLPWVAGGLGAVLLAASLTRRRRRR